MDLTKARESMLDLLSQFLKQDPTFNNIAYWEKRIQIISLTKTKSILDNQDVKYYKNLICQDSKSVDNYLITRDSASSNVRVSTN